MSSKKVIDGLVLSGGGVKGIAELGALQCFVEKEYCSSAGLEYYSGTSVGSIICLLLICGYSPFEIFKEVYTMTNLLGIAVPNLPGGSSIASIIETVKNKFEGVGLLPIEPLSKIIETLIVKKIGFSPTFQELYDMSRKFLYVSAADVTNEQMTYFSVVTHPNMKCVDAVTISCRIPLIFEKGVYNGIYYCDGGLGDNFPFRPIIDRAKKILGIVVDGFDPSFDIETKIGYLYRLFAFPMRENTGILYDVASSNPKCNVLKITITDVTVMDFSLDQTKKMNLFVHGYKEAEKLVEWGWA